MDSKRDSKREKLLVMPDGLTLIKCTLNNVAIISNKITAINLS